MLQMSIRAVFSKYSITPARALNFGPVPFNSPALPRALEVTNIGEVPFTLRLFDPVKGLQVIRTSNRQIFSVPTMYNLHIHLWTVVTK